MEVKEKQYRNSSIEILRIISMLLITSLHLIGFNTAFNYNEAKANNFFILLLFFIAHIGVSSFMFISGYYGIKPIFKSGFKLYFQTAFYFISLSLITYFIYHTGLKNIFWGLSPMAGPWWFIKGYFIIYLLSFFINEGIQKISQKTFLCILIVYSLFIYTTLFLSADYGSSLYILLYIYLLGRYMNLYKIQIKHPIIIFLLFIISQICATYLIIYLGKSNLYDFWHSNYNPFITLGSVSLFFIFFKYNFYNKIINSFSSKVLAVYLITEQSIEVRNYIINLFNLYFNFTSLSIILYAFFLLVICVIIDTIINVITEPIKLIIENFLSNIFNNIRVPKILKEKNIIQK